MFEIERFSKQCINTPQSLTHCVVCNSVFAHVNSSHIAVIKQKDIGIKIEFNS